MNWLREVDEHPVLCAVVTALAASSWGYVFYLIATWR